MKTFHVYCILNSLTKGAYVGCTSRIDARWTEHKRRLGLGEHSSPRLQAAWNEHGADAFRFVILEILVDAAYATAKRAELLWISKIGTYNEVGADVEAVKFILPNEARMALGERNRARAQTPEQRANMAEKTKLRWADPEQRAALMNAPNRGKDKYKGMPPTRTAEKDAEHSERMKEMWATSVEKRAELAKRNADRWADPAAKARQAEKMRAYHAARRNTGV